MGKVVNLNKFRKQKTREAAADKAAENRARHGRSKADKALEQARETLAREQFEQRRRDTPPEE